MHLHSVSPPAWLCCGSHTPLPCSPHPRGALAPPPCARHGGSRGGGGALRGTRRPWGPSTRPSTLAIGQLRAFAASLCLSPQAHFEHLLRVAGWGGEGTRGSPTAAHAQLAISHRERGLLFLGRGAPVESASRLSNRGLGTLSHSQKLSSVPRKFCLRRSPLSMFTIAENTTMKTERHALILPSTTAPTDRAPNHPRHTARQRHEAGDTGKMLFWGFPEAVAPGPGGRRGSSRCVGPPVTSNPLRARQSRRNRSRVCPVLVKRLKPLA